MEAPWLLMFSGGECFYSKKFTGFVERLRDYPEITLPPILLVEPLMFDKYCGDGGCIAYMTSLLQYRKRKGWRSTTTRATAFSWFPRASPARTLRPSRCRCGSGTRSTGWWWW